MSSGNTFKNPWWVVFGSTIGLDRRQRADHPIHVRRIPEAHRGRVWLEPRHSGIGGYGLAGFGALATPFVGRMVDRWGVRRVTLPFITAFALTTAAIALTPASPFIFILLYGICGLAGGGQAPLNYAKAISAWFESKRGLALGIAMAGVGIGTALDPQIVRVLIESCRLARRLCRLGSVDVCSGVSRRGFVCSRARSRFARTTASI